MKPRLELAPARAIVVDARAIVVDARAFIDTRTCDRRIPPTTKVPAWTLVALAALIAHTGVLAAPEPQVLYHNYCSVCHGDKGDGRSRASASLSTRPRDFTTEASKRDLSRERITAAITHGVPGTAMVGWKTQLSANDIAALADHVHNRFVLGTAAPLGPSAAISGTRAHGGREGVPPVATVPAAAHATVPQAMAAATPAAATLGVDMSVAMPNGLAPDIERGGKYYNANCATCHGEKGDGKGPRAYFINPKPRNFVEAATRARFNRVALYAAISEGRNGSEMPAWKHVATPQEIADVAEYVFRSFIFTTGDSGKRTAATASPTSR